MKKNELITRVAKTLMAELRPVVTTMLSAAVISALCMQAGAAAPQSSSTLKRPETIVDGTSAQNRVDKSYLLTAQLAGAAVSPVPAMGVNAGYYFSPNSLAQLEFSKGAFPFFFGTISATTLAGNYKHFFGNSFYTKTGAVYRQIEISDVMSIFNTNLGTIGEATSLGAELAIGNQWQWSNFTLGCDWFGAMVPVATLSTRYNSYGLSAADRKDLDEAWDRLAKVTSFEVLRFYLGASF